jgi:outer membrane immunogenic protein
VLFRRDLRSGAAVMQRVANFSEGQVAGLVESGGKGFFRGVPRGRHKMMFYFIPFEAGARRGGDKGLTLGSLVNPQRAGLSLAATLAPFAVCVFIAAAGSAGAADLSNLKESPVARPAPVPAFSWTGFYVGVNGGYGYDHFAFKYTYHPLAGYEQSTSGINSGGIVLGGQIGYNYQLSNLPFIGHAVVGVEAGSDWSGIGGATNVTTPLAALMFGTKFENFGTVRGRVGYDFDRLLLYFAGGTTYAINDTYYGVNGVTHSITVTRYGFDWDFGIVSIGAEYAITNNFTIRAEYSYDFSGARWEQFSPTSTSAIGFGTRSMYHIVRLGLNYKFDLFEPASVVAN